MGCSGSKEDDLPLLVRCRERRDLIRAAANHRYSLAAAHVSYFHSLTEVGDALRKFVDEELVTASTSSSSSFSSPSLILPPVSKNKSDNADESSFHLHDVDEDLHLDLSDSSSQDEDSDDFNYHHHGEEDNMHQHHAHVSKGKGFEDESSRLHNDVDSPPTYFPHNFYGYASGFGSEFVNNNPYANPYPYASPYGVYADPYSDRWGPPAMQPSSYYSSNSGIYYMKNSAPTTKTVVQNPPAEPSYGYSDAYWNPLPGYGGNYGYPPKVDDSQGAKPKEAPPPPPPIATAWDFFNPFDMVDSGYPSYYSSGGFGYGSNCSSPDSNEVREREGIPDLEEETETEMYKEVYNDGSTRTPLKKRSGGSNSRSRSQPVHRSGDGSSRSVRGKGSLRSIPSNKTDRTSRLRGVNSSSRSKKSDGSWKSASLHKVDSSSVSLPSSSESEKPHVPPHYSKESSKPSKSSQYNESEKLSGNRELSSSISLTDEKSSSENVVLESVDEGSLKKKGVTFEVEEITNSKLSSVILSPRGTRDLREVVAEIRDEFETASRYGMEVGVMLEVGKIPYQPSFLKVILSRLLYLIYPSVSELESPSKQSAKLDPNTAKLSKSYLEHVDSDINFKACNLSSTLDKIYAWEKKLYKEVKDEERLRVAYEKQSRMLKVLDENGAESTKIDIARASIRRLLTKLDVSIKAIDTISNKIHKLRDEELQPQVAELIHGLTRMWKAMLKCHQKQFQAMMESKMRKLRANTALQMDSASRATTKLERELQAWCERFNEWISFQKSYVKSLNGWLLQCLCYEPENTADGEAPFSPGRLGAPPIFMICNDWHQAMEAISEGKVSNAMNTFSTSLHQLWKKQDEEGRQRLKKEYLKKDYEKHVRESGKQKGGLSMIQSDSGSSGDTMKHRVSEERLKHKDAIRLLHDAASSSLQGGLIPIFKALERFTSEALEAHQHVRV